MAFLVVSPFIHSGYYYSASSGPLLLRSTFRHCTDTVSVWQSPEASIPLGEWSRNLHHSHFKGK